MSFSAVRMNFIGFVLKALKKKNKAKDTDIPINEVAFKRILVISNKLLGDFLFCTPAIRALKEKYPDAKILLILNPKNKGIVGNNDFINEVAYMENNISNVFKILKITRKFKPEISVIFHSRTPYDFIISVLSGCHYILKHYFNNDIKKLFFLCDDYVLDVKKPPVINHLALVEKLGCETEGKKMFFPCDVEKFGSRKLNLKIGYQLGASKPNRYLPLHTLQEISKKINVLYPECEFHLFGAPAEVALGDEFISGLEPIILNKVTNFIGKTTLSELASAVDNVDILITPDTGTLHVATALQVKTISLFVCRRENGCEPQQDPDLHSVIYASDYNDLAYDRLQSKPLEFIPCDVIFDTLKGMVVINNRM